MKTFSDITTQNDTVIDWYRSAYPEDEQGAAGFEYAAEMTWSELEAAYRAGERIIVWNDTVIRERVFAELAKRLGVMYDDIYDAWLEDQF